MIKKFFCDLETTGLSPKKNGVLEIGGIIECGTVLKEFHLQCRPYAADEITQGALNVNKLTQDEINSFPPAPDTYQKLIHILSRHVDRYNKKDKFFFVAYNATFDSQFLREFFKKSGDQYYGSWFWHPFIDVMTLAAFHLMKDRAYMPDFHLDTVAKHIGVEVDEGERHTTMYDIQLTRKLYYKLIDKEEK